MTSKYVTESRAGHVTFPRVFPIGLWGVRYSLFIIIIILLEVVMLFCSAYLQTKKFGVPNMKH